MKRIEPAIQGPVAQFLDNFNRQDRSPQIPDFNRVVLGASHQTVLFVQVEIQVEDLVSVPGQEQLLFGVSQIRN